MGGHCFTYGSLMSPDIMTRVAGCACQGVPAYLDGYSRHPVRAEEYPGMIPSPDGRVEGVLYRDLPDSAWPRLDAFEGVMYLRRRVSVRTPDGSCEPAWTYVFREDYAHLLEPGDWDLDAFLRHGKARFESRYLGFDALPAETDAAPGSAGDQAEPSP